jgi:hypothetical protein
MKSASSSTCSSSTCDFVGQVPSTDFLAVSCLHTLSLIKLKIGFVKKILRIGEAGK